MKTILLDNGHGVPCLAGGKCSPDRRLIEAMWAREIAMRVCKALQDRGVDARLLVPEERDVAILERVRRVNDLAKKLGRDNVLLVSVHVNAAGSDNCWHGAHGWSVFVAKNASRASRRLAARLTDLADARGLTEGRCVPPEKFWTWSWTDKDIMLLRNTICPAVLTENMFQDNRDDVELLLSEAGKQMLVDLHVEGILAELGIE